MDPISLFAVAITLADIGARGLHFALELHESYRGAEIQMKTVQHQYCILQEAMERVPPEFLSRMEATKDLLDAIRRKFPGTFQCESRKDRWLWAIKRKRKGEALVDQLERVEDSIRFLLHLGNG